MPADGYRFLNYEGSGVKGQIPTCDKKILRGDRGNCSSRRLRRGDCNRVGVMRRRICVCGLYRIGAGSV